MKFSVVFILLLAVILLCGCMYSPKRSGSTDTSNGSGAEAEPPGIEQPPAENLPCTKGTCVDIPGMWYAGGKCMVKKCTCSNCEKYWDCWNLWGTGECQSGECRAKYGTEYTEASNEYVYIEDPTKTTMEECEG